MLHCSKLRAFILNIFFNVQIKIWLRLQKLIHFKDNKQYQQKKETSNRCTMPTSNLGSNIFFNIKHSLGTPIVSMEGTVTAGTWRPAPGNPASPGTGACTRGATRGDTTGAAPRIGAVDRGRPGLLSTGEPSEPAMLQIMEVDVRETKSNSLLKKRKKKKRKKEKLKYKYKLGKMQTLEWCHCDPTSAWELL